MTMHAPTISGYPVDISVEYQKRHGRLATFFVLLLAIPHFIVLSLFGIVIQFVVMLMWFAIVITVRSPRGMHNFVVGHLRWSTRVNAYTMLLTDRYPPFGTD